MPPMFPIDPVTSPLTPEAFRNQVRNLLLSYHDADIDFLAEIVQNAVDAVEDRFATSNTEPRPTIDITVDTERRIIEIADNGTGIPDETLQTLGCPNFSNKTRRSKRGHKGVGLTFAVWSSKAFFLATKRRGEAQPVSAKLESAIDWIQAESGNHPTIQAAPEFDPPFLHDQISGTVFRFELPETGRLARLVERLNERGIQTLLRMQTAVGFADLPHLDVQDAAPWVRRCLISVHAGEREIFEVPMGFYFPHEFFGQRASFDVRRLSTLTIEKQQRFHGRMKCLYTILDSTKTEALFSAEDQSELLKVVRQQGVAAYAAFLDAKGSFNEWNNALYREGAGVGRRRGLVAPGIHFVTATMPAGEIVNVDLPFGGGNKDRLFVVIQFRDVKPDVGRKTFERQVIEIGQRIAGYLCDEVMVPNRKLLIPHQVPHGDTEHEQAMSLDALKRRAETKERLRLPQLGISTIPETEQEVVALFNALLGAGLLKGYDLLSVFGSSEKYDAVFRYEIAKERGTQGPAPLCLHESAFGRSNLIKFPASMLEFKPMLSNLIDDFEGGTKVVDEIRLAVAWDKGNEAAFCGSSDYRLEACSGRSPRDKQFYGETHLLTMTTSSSRLHVILLRDVIAALAS